MGRAWLDILQPDTGAGTVRFELKPGLTMLGGLRGDVAVPASGSDCVHLWSEPPKLIFVGAGEPPSVNDRPSLEVALHSGDRIAWRGFRATFGHDDGQAKLEELPAPAAAASRAPAFPGAAGSAAVVSPAAGVGAPIAPGPSGAAGFAPRPASGELAAGGELGAGHPWRHLKAGILAEQGLTDRSVIKRWQDAVIRGEFDSASAARDLLAAAPGVEDADPRLGERCTRLMRDLLMSSLSRSPLRQARKVARSGLAFLLVQLMVFLVFLLLVLLALLLLHARFGYSIDALLDRFLELF